MTILACDPGDMCGIAVWSDKWEKLLLTQVTLEELPDTWAKIEADYGRVSLAIVEDFVLFSQRAKQQSGSRMKASQGIGMLKALANLSAAEIVFQPSSVYRIGAKYAGIEIPTKHADSHQWVAYSHGYYFGVKNGLIKSQLQLKKEREHGA